MHHQWISRIIIIIIKKHYQNTEDTPMNIAKGTNRYLVEKKNNIPKNIEMGKAGKALLNTPNKTKVDKRP